MRQVRPEIGVSKCASSFRSFFSSQKAKPIMPYSITFDIPEKLHDNVVAEIDVSQYKNMRDLNKKIKDTFVALITLN